MKGAAGVKKISLNAEVVGSENKRKLDSEEAVETADLIADITSRLGPDLGAVLSKGASGRQQKQSQESYRATQHVVIGTSTGEYFIVSRLGSRNDVQLITVEPELGTLRYEHQAHHDLFDSVEDALEHITTTLGLEITYRCVARALLGYAVLGPFGCLLVATQVARDSVLPGGHLVCTVAETAWVKIPLRRVLAEDAAELRNVDALMRYQVNGLHFYCETCDLTRGFCREGAEDVYEGYDRSFAWNGFLSEAFERQGLREWCPVLLQGACRCSLFPDGVSLCLIAKKCADNPGTRYNARGMNARHSPGNELECELLVWTRTRWARYAWRRGTVPIWWRSEPPKGVGDSDIVVREEGAYEGCAEYMNDVMERFGRPLTVVNLLAESPLKRESFLADHFKKAIAAVNAAAGNEDVALVNYDWHARMKELGPDANVETLWDTLKKTFEASGISCGSIVQPGSDGTVHDYDPSKCDPLTRGVRLEAEKRQNGVCRFNCADSLDRTNIVTFFVCIQVLAEMCSALGVRGFEKRKGEEDATTTGADDSSWFGAGMSYRKLAGMLTGTGLLCGLADSFIFVGDVCSILYTYSLAAYSGPMRVHSTNPKDAPSNALIAVQRRYQNMVNDPFRQTQFEMFCGVDRAKYFPSLGRATGSATVPPLEIVSDYPSCVLSRTEAATAATGKANVTTITLALRKPAVLRELLLTVSANSAGEIRPTDTCRMTLYVGPYVDALRPVFYNLVVPTVSLGVAMEYFIPSTIWGAYDEQIYPVNGTGNGMNRESTDGNNSSNKRPGKVLGAYSRFVRITFTASNSAVTVDRMELRGWPLAPGPVAMCAAAASGPAAAPEALQGYEELVTKAAQERAFDLSTALTLEVVRIDGGISPAERDEVMVRHKLSRELDPQSFVYRRDEALESRLLENTAPTEGCAECQAVADTFVCPGCRQRFCRKCGAPVLQAVPEYFLGAPRLVCKSCLPLVQRRQEMLAVQQQQVMLERVAAHSPAQFIRAQGVAEYPHPVPELCPGSSWRLRELSDMRRVETDLALFPRACFARSLPLGRDGVPPEVMLVDGSEGASWTVDGKSQLTLVVVFMVDSLVTSLDIEMTSSGNSSGGGCDDAVATVEVKAGNSLDGLDNDSGYAQTPAHGPLSVLLRGTVVAIRIIPKDPAQQLTVKRLHIRGKPSPKEELGQAGKGKDKRKDKKRKSVSSILSKRSLISQQKVEEHPGGAAPTRRVVDVFFGHGKASVIHGFGLTIPAVKDPAALPRLVRASVLQLVQRKKSKTLEPQGRIVLGTYVVPKCATAEGAVLVYNFDTPAQGNVLRLECVANYGSQEQTLLGKISLF